MPWLAYPMKDVQSCDKLGGAATTRYYSEISEWGNPFSIIRENPHADGHLPNWNISVSREKKSIEIPSVATSEMGKAQIYTV